MASLGTIPHSSASTSPSVADRSQVLAETEAGEVLLPHGSHRRSRSADIETRSSRGGKVCLGDTAKEVPVVPNDFPSSLMNNSLSTSDFTDAVLTSKDIGPDLSWIQSMLYDIKRQSVNNRQLLGWICHNLGMAVPRHEQKDEGEEEEDVGDTTAFQIFTPLEISRQSSSASLDETAIPSDARRHHHIPSRSASNQISSASEMSIQISVDNGALGDECLASPRAVIETASICMAKSFEKFNVKGHYFPKVHTTSGDQDWEQYISTNKGLRKGGA